MPVVNGLITAPGGVPADPAARVAVITLVDQGGHTRIGYTTDSREMVGPWTVQAGTDGAWTATLPANSDVDTDWGDSLYRVREGYDPDLRQPFQYYISVPSGGGPYAVGGLRLALPGAAPVSLVGYLPLSGGTLSGPLTLPGAPSNALHAATKAYVDSAGGGGSYLAIANNLSDVANAGTARTNLGLGNAATKNTGTSAGTVAVGDDSRITGAAQKASNLSDLGSASTARTNLGLGGAAVLAVGTTAGTVAAGDDSRVTGAAQKASNLSDLGSASTARTNLGLGGAALLSVGTSAGTVAAGDDSRVTGAAQKASNLSDLANAGTARTNLGLGGAAVLSVGSTAGTVAAGDDARFTDQRTPLDASVTSAKIVDGAIVNADVNAAAAIALSKLAADPLARANHTGTQTASTVSDFATTVAATAALKANNLSDLASAATARTNLGALASSVVPDVNAMFPPVYRVGRQPTGTVLTTMQSGHGYTQTGTGTSGLNDTTDFLSGLQSAWVQSGGGGAQCNLRKYASALGDTTGKMLRFRVKVDSLTHVSELNVIIGKNSIGDSYKFSWHTNGNRFLNDGDWSTVTLSWANAVVDSGTPLRTDPTDAVFQCYDDSAGTVKMHVQSLELVANGHTAFPNGLVSICFDDAYAGPKTYGWTKLDSYGYPASMFVIQDYLGVGGRLTLQDLRDRSDRYGWEVAAHASTGANHASSQTGLTAAALDADLRTQRATLEALGFRGSSGYAYPLGQFGATSDAAKTIDITRRYMAYARTTHNKTTETLPPADPYRLRAISSISAFAGGNTPSGITTATTGRIDKAKAEGAWLILVFHDITSGAATSTSECAQSDFNAIIDKINSAGMPVLTIEDALRAVSA